MLVSRGLAPPTDNYLSNSSAAARSAVVIWCRLLCRNRITRVCSSSSISKADYIGFGARNNINCRGHRTPSLIRLCRPRRAADVGGLIPRGPRGLDVLPPGSVTRIIASKTLIRMLWGQINLESSSLRSSVKLAATSDWLDAARLVGYSDRRGRLRRERTISRCCRHVRDIHQDDMLTTSRVLSLRVFGVFFSPVIILVVSTSAVDCLERLVSITTLQ